jgi:hypothetical protein
MSVEPELSRRAWAPGIALLLLLGITGCGPEAPRDEAQDEPRVTAFARPNFLAPFPCGQSWTYSHHSGEVRRALDFVRNGGVTDGQPALASAAGYATRQYEAGGAGNYIKIDHGGGWVTYYFHLQSYSVANGTQVNQGQEVGRTGSTGASTGPHLHFEQLLNGVGQDIIINGVAMAPYPSSYGTKSITSTNCGTPPPPPPTLDVFVQATDSAIWRKQWTGSAWLNWESLGGVLGTAPASASMAPGTQHVYAVGTNGELFQKAWNGTAWSGWESLGGTAALSRPGAASMGPGLMHVFVRGTDNHLYQKYWTGNAWSAWENLDGQLLSGPSAVSMARGTVHVFARGPGNTLWMKYWTGSAWVGWEDLGGDLASGPGVVSMAPGTLHVFVRGSDNAVWMKYWTGSAWSAWENLGGDAVGDPWALSNEPGKLHVFTRATDGAAWQKTWNGSSWSGWMSLGGNLK